MSEPLDPQQKKFQRYFIGLIVFIVAVLVVAVLIGRGSLAVI